MISPGAVLDRSVLVLQDYVEASDEAAVAALCSVRVRLRASAETLMMPTAHAALVAAFQTIARLGAEIVLEIPGEASSGVCVPLLRHDSLFEGLDALAARLIRPLGSPGACDLNFTFDDSIGDGELALGGSDFEARLRVGRSAGGWSGIMPFGAMLAGSAAGAEVARLAIRRLVDAGATQRERIALEHRDVSMELPPFTYPARGIDLGDVEFVSAGAITHALLFTLLWVPDVQLLGRVFDDDDSAEHNLNRYLLLDADGLGVSKVGQLAALDWPGIDLEGVLGRVGQDELRELELSDRVCVGVDSVEARWNIQRLAPGWAGVGATTHALAMASEHWPDTPCAGCVHPVPAELAPRLPTISFVSLLGGALLAYRLIRVAVAPAHSTEVLVALDAFNLAAPASLLIEHPKPSQQCPVGCDASRSV